jgi:hypothetical protein
MDSPNPKPRKKTPQNAGKVAQEAIEQAKASAEAAPEKKKTGRPSKYTPEIAQEICEQLADGIPLRQICRQDGYPAWQTIYDWMYRDDALGEEGVGLSRAIARAREVGYDSMAEECLSIADDATNDWMEKLDKDGDAVGWMLNGDHVQRSKLRIETRLKLLAKFNPKKYGDKLALGGDPGNPLQAQVDVTIFDTLVQTLEARRQDKANG